MHVCVSGPGEKVFAVEVEVLTRVHTGENGGVLEIERGHKLYERWE